MIPNSCLSPVVGRPFADTICMILVIIRMRVLAEKRKELSQTISSLISSIRTEKGCQRCNFCRYEKKKYHYPLFSASYADRHLCGLCIDTHT